METKNIIVILLVLAIVFSIVSAVLVLSVVNTGSDSVQPAQPKVVYSGQAVQGNPNGGVSLYVQPRGAG